MKSTVELAINLKNLSSSVTACSWITSACSAVAALTSNFWIASSASAAFLLTDSWKLFFCSSGSKSLLSTSLSNSAFPFWISSRSKSLPTGLVELMSANPSSLAWSILSLSSAAAISFWAFAAVWLTSSLAAASSSSDKFGLFPRSVTFSARNVPTSVLAASLTVVKSWFTGDAATGFSTAFATGCSSSAATKLWPKNRAQIRTDPTPKTDFRIEYRKTFSVLFIFFSSEHILLSWSVTLNKKSSQISRKSFRLGNF